METSVKSYLILSVILSIFFIFATQVESATLVSKRNMFKRDTNSQTETPCRTNAVCGWEVYDSFTRNREYYVSSSCKCISDEQCIRMDDDISLSAYVYRCRPRRNKNKNKTTARPSSGSADNTTS